MNFISSLVVVLFSSATLAFFVGYVDGSDTFIKSPLSNTLLVALAGPFNIFNGEILVGLVCSIPWFIGFLMYANLKRRDDRKLRIKIENEIKESLEKEDNKC